MLQTAVVNLQYIKLQIKETEDDGKAILYSMLKDEKKKKEEGAGLHEMNENLRKPRGRKFLQPERETWQKEC